MDVAIQEIAGKIAAIKETYGGDKIFRYGGGGQVRLVTKAGAANVLISVDDRMMRGTPPLPNGLGLLYPDGEGKEAMLGVAPDELTTTGLRDKFLGMRLHKHVPACIEPPAAA